MRLVLVAFAIIVALGAFAVILFVLHPPKEWKGDGSLTQVELPENK